MNLPEPYEYPYFRERALKIAARQKQGQVLISAAQPDSGQGLPLPYIHDIENLHRSSYPYDYECEYGRFKYEYDLSAFVFTPNNGKFPPEWDGYELHAPILPVIAVIDRARRLAIVKAGNREITLQDVPVSENGFDLLRQINAAIAQARQPFMVWRLEWTGEIGKRLWSDRTPAIKNDHGSAYLTGYAHDRQCNLVYLGMVGHKTVLESIRATIQGRQRKKLFIEGSPIYPLSDPYLQTWQHLTDYGAYHAAMVASPAVPGRWQPGDEMAYLLVFDSDLQEGGIAEDEACTTLPRRLSEALPIPVLEEWAKHLWEAGLEKELLGALITGGDCLAGYWLHLSESGWAQIITQLIEEHKIEVSCV